MNAHYSEYIKQNENRDFYNVVPASKRNYSCVRLAALSATLYFSAVTSVTSAYQADSTKVVQHEFIDGIMSPNTSSLVLSFTYPTSETKLSITKTAEEIHQDKVFSSFEASFMSNDLTSVEYEYFYPVFNQLANSLKVLPSLGNHVSISRDDGTVMYNILLPNNVLLTISKAAYQMNKTNDVMFSISVNKRMLVVDRMPIDELVKCVLDTINELA